MSDEKRQTKVNLPERTHPATAADLEALLFVVDRPLTRKEAAKLLEADRAAFDRLVNELQKNLASRGITLVTHGDELQLTSGPEQARAVLAWIGTGGSDMTAAPLETLTVIAYRQPVTKAGIEEIRGVDADYGLRVLLERGLIEEVDRLETAGRPHRYATTLEFLRKIGLSSLADLPVLEGDAESLLHLQLASETVGGGEATDARDAEGPSSPSGEGALAD
jgi:segregation and condensation protein B